MHGTYKRLFVAAMCDMALTQQGGTTFLIYNSTQTQGLISLIFA